MLQKALQSAICEAILDAEGKEVTIEGASPVGGGSINDAFQLRTDSGSYFVKVNHAHRYPKMFEAEAKGLQLLRDSGEILIPKVVTYGQAGDKAFIVMEHIESDGISPDFWEDFGTQLAKMHQHTNEHFGLDHANYIGSLPQHNTPHDNWPDFFAHERLEFQTKMALDDGKINKGETRKFEKLNSKLGKFFPEESPALIHGDLWSGNYMSGPSGEPCIMDPAVYYGHREMDIGMTQMFGGFDPEFYESYKREYPLEKGWQERLDLCNLYPLMVHVNLFGGGYLMEVKSILKRFV